LERITEDGFKMKLVARAYAVFPIKIVATWKGGDRVIKEYNLHVSNVTLKIWKRFIKSEEKRLREGNDVVLDFTIVSVLSNNVGSVVYEGKDEEGVLHHILEVRQEELRFVSGKYREEKDTSRVSCSWIRL
jgi:hypothetical protein